MNQRCYPGRISPFPNYWASVKPRQQVWRGRNRYFALLAAVAAALMIGVHAAPAHAKDLSQQERIILIRGLDREIAVAKIALPLGKHGVFVDDKGQLDQERARQELREHGTAISPGMPVEITKVTFKPHQVILQINNGGKKHEKWYQHLQIGMGGMEQPVVQRQGVTEVANGSSITLTFRDEKMSNLKVEQVKQLLSQVLDFHRQLPTALYSPNIPPQFKEAIKKHQVLVGMDKEAVLSSKGPPFRKIRQTKSNGEETEDWLYGLPPHTLFVTFAGDAVVAVRQY
jgi:hypothetical protein